MPARPPHRIHIPGAQTALPLWMLYPVFFAAVYFSHLTLLRLPYFWDEGGYYIPAAYDFFRTGTLIPFSTLSNAHPPLPAILLATWWHLSGFVPSGTRTFICMVAAAGLLAVYRLARHLLGTRPAIAVALLAALYPIWFAQSTLAHADIFAASFTLWGLSLYFESLHSTALPPALLTRHKIYAAVVFSLAALSKETAVITPAVLALFEAVRGLRERHLRSHASWIAALLFPILPLAAWYAYHRHRTGFAFGNPDFLRYNATANLNATRVILSLYHRFLHLTLHMNLFVPVICTLAVVLAPVIAGRAALARPVLQAIAVVLVANWIAFSILGGALLTRYLLPMYPLVLLLCVAEWQRRIARWEWLAVLSAAAFLAGLWINPPYSFAPEDNLTYRDLIVLHQRAVHLIAEHWPQATVLTVWPGNTELERPELGYTTVPIQAFAIKNFSRAELEAAAAEPDQYDLAFVFSTKWIPPPGYLNIARPNTSTDGRYFDFHQDLHPDEAASVLHGEVAWQAYSRGEWVAILRFRRIENASLRSSNR